MAELKDKIVLITGADGGLALPKLVLQSNTFYKMKTKFFLILVSVLIGTNTFSQTKNGQSQIDSVPFVTTSDNVKLYVKVSGKGPVCIYVHGGPGAWSKSFENMKGNRLEKKLRMVYYDQRGCGRSAVATDKNYSLDRMVDDIEDIRRSLGEEKVYLLSHSFGGILAVSYAKKYPNHLRGLILTNSTLNLNYSLEQQIKYINHLINKNFAVQNADSLMSVFGAARSALSERGLDFKMLSDKKKTVELLDSIDNSYNRSTDFVKHLWDFPEYKEDFTKLTKNIEVPVLVITGKKDYAIGVDHYKAFHFPKQKVLSINGGHVLYYEQNKEFIKAVFSFID